MLKISKDRGVRPKGLWRLGLALLLVAGCAKEKAPLRKIAGHTLSESGVAHGAPPLKPERYCRGCHGETLSGGPRGEPACLTCHGTNWEPRDGSVSAAPADHTVDHGGFRHHPGLRDPAGQCATCHGDELQGRVDGGLTQPGCYLCHGALWEEPSKLE